MAEVLVKSWGTGSQPKPRSEAGHHGPVTGLHAGGVFFGRFPEFPECTVEQSDL